MNYRKQGLRALGLSFVAVLGLMAFMASGAQANFQYLLTVNGVIDDVPDNLPTVSAHSEGVLLVPGKNLEIKCPTVESDPSAPVLLLASSTVAHGHLIFSGCKTFTISPLTEQTKCKPWSPGQVKESGIILAGGLAELVLHPTPNSKSYVLFKPLVVGGVTQPFTTIELPETCALAETSKVTGSLVAECGELVAGAFSGGNCATHRVKQLLRSVTAGLFPADVLKFGANEAFIDGIAAVELGGALAGKSWGGVAP